MLQTERLTIREVSATDLDDIYELHCIPEVDRYNTYGIPENKGVIEREISLWQLQQTEIPRRNYVLCITLKGSNEFAGLIALNLGAVKYRSGEIWYKLHPKYWSKGYMTEAVKAILKFAFEELQLHRVEAGCATENTASVRVLEKTGMVREGHKRKALPIRGEWVDNYEYAILREAFILT